LTDGSIKLLHKESGSPVFVKETQIIGEKGKKVVDEDVDFFEVDVNAPEDADLHITEPAKQHLTELATRIVRRNSLKKTQSDIPEWAE